VEHVVFFPSPDGTPAFRRLGSLDDAARFVEHLRNVENVNEASVHSLTEVPLAFKAWYRVELPEDAAPAQTSDAAYPNVSAEALAPVPDHSAAGNDASAFVDDGIVDSEPAEVADAVELPSHVEIPAPATIAEVIESYTNADAARQLELPTEPVNPTGSATGIVVPERNFARLEQQQYAFAPAGGQVAPALPPATAAPESAPGASQRVPVRTEPDGERREAQVLEPIFGARRDRGIGYFAR
jgi:hypothetical protein